MNSPSLSGPVAGCSVKQELARNDYPPRFVRSDGEGVWGSRRGFLGRQEHSPAAWQLYRDCNGLLQAELECDGQVHGNGFAVERRRLIFPLFQSVHGRLL